VARVRSKDAVLEDLADPNRVGNLEDPKAMTQWMKKVGGALGEETGEDIEAEVDEMLAKANKEGGDGDEE
ncbi:MAG: zinc ribbon domain-containing protein, partial [Candidatus Binatia bacterium]